MSAPTSFEWVIGRICGPCNHERHEDCDEPDCQCKSKVCTDRQKLDFQKEFDAEIKRQFPEV